jgi:hypothetical protein
MESTSASGEDTERRAAFNASPLTRFVVGAIATFYGRHATYLLLFAQVYREKGHPLLLLARRALMAAIHGVRRQAPRIREASDASRDAMRRLGILQDAYLRASQANDEAEAAVLQAELQELQQDVMRMGAASSSVLGAVNPSAVLASVRGLYASIAALSAAATANGAVAPLPTEPTAGRGRISRTLMSERGVPRCGQRRVGIHFDVGERAVTVVRAIVEPLLRSLLAEARRCSPGALPPFIPNDTAHFTPTYTATPTPRLLHGARERRHQSPSGPNGSSHSWPHARP